MLPLLANPLSLCPLFPHPNHPDRPGIGVGEAHRGHDTLEAIAGLPEDSIMLLLDYHLFFDDPNPILLRAMKQELRAARTKSKTLVVLGCRLKLPPELEREFAVIEFALPGEAVLAVALDGIAESAKLPAPKEERESLLNAAKGMTALEAENAYALSVVETGRLEAEVFLLFQMRSCRRAKRGQLKRFIESSLDLVPRKGRTVSEVERLASGNFGYGLWP